MSNCKLSMIRENNPFISNLLHKIISLNLCSCLEVNHSYLGICTVEFIIGKYVRNRISTINEIIDNQYFELRKILDDLGHILDFSSSIFAINIYHLYALHADEVGKKIGRQQSSPRDRNHHIWFESTMNDLVCEDDAFFL